MENKDLTTFIEDTDITFNLSGNVKVVWKVDSDKILADIFGKKKKDSPPFAAFEEPPDPPEIIREAGFPEC